MVAVNFGAVTTRPGIETSTIRMNNAQLNMRLL
jgi:hypothetical protein